ncbi:MAG: hypothetical protein RR780_05875 [Cellulosilyticaceae bacterium]
MEVILCIVMMGVVISPILKMLHTSWQVRNEAQSIYEVTYLMQNMMEEIREVIPAYLEYEIDNSFLPEYERKYVKQIEGLLEGTQNEIGSVIEFLKLEEDNEEDFCQRYELEKYVYDIGIWRVGELVEEDLMQEIPYDKVTKLSTKESGEEAIYQDLFKQLIDEGELAFNMKSDYNLFQTNYKNPQTYRGKCMITWQRNEDQLESLLRDSEGEIQEETALLTNGEDLWGWVERIRRDEKDYYQIKTDKQEESGEVKIIIDLGKLENFKEKEAEIDYRQIVVQNETNYDLAVELMYSSTESETFNRSLIEQLVAFDNENKTMIVIQGESGKRIEDSFIIIGLVRRKTPELGEKGKVIKKMIEIYSPRYN